MGQLNKSALVPFSSTQMFDLVNDVERYPEFVPGCRSVVVHARDESMLEATLSLRRGGMDLTLRTRNLLERPASIHMNYVQGPLKTFDAQWIFQPLGDRGCKVQFNARFELLGLVQRAFEPVLATALNELVDAFVARAKLIYTDAPNQ